MQLSLSLTCPCLSAAVYEGEFYTVRSARLSHPAFVLVMFHEFLYFVTEDSWPEYRSDLYSHYCYKTSSRLQRASERDGGGGREGRMSEGVRREVFSSPVCTVMYKRRL